MKKLEKEVKAWQNSKKTETIPSSFEREAQDWVANNKVQTHIDGSLHPSSDAYIKKIFKENKKL